MTLRRRISLWWTDSPWIVRMGVFLIALILALILFGCAALSQPSAGASLITQTEAICDANPRHLPGCIVGFGIWIKAHF